MSRMTLLLSILTPILGLANIAHAQFEPGWHDDRAIHSGGLTRYYRYYVPETLPATRPPMVIYLHGGTGSMRSAMPPSGNGSAHWPAIADAHGFVLMVPNGINGATGDALGDAQNWNDCRGDPGPAESRADDVSFITALIDWAAEHLDIDTSRVYVTGSSNGGMMSYRLADEAPQRFAAVAAFIANQPQNSECAVRDHALPIMIVVGTEDTLMPFDGGQVANTRGAVLSAEATRDRWLERNRLSASDPERIQFADLDPGDDSVVRGEVYAGQGLEVRYYVMEGGGHAMPSIERNVPPGAQLLVGPQNHDIEGAAEAWSFFQRFTAAAPEHGGSLSGLWYDPSLPGDGYNLVAAEDVAVVYFYGWDTLGNRLWLVSEPFTAALSAGSEIDIEMLIATGGNFELPADPGSGLSSWGRLRWRIRSCGRIDSTLEGDDGDIKAATLSKLLGVAGGAC